MHDKYPEVADTAKEVYNVCFSYAGRNAMKKQLVINGSERPRRCGIKDARRNRSLKIIDQHGSQSIVLIYKGRVY